MASQNHKSQVWDYSIEKLANDSSPALSISITIPMNVHIKPARCFLCCNLSRVI